ncbi:MAG: hypothetical protein PWP51_2850 [Clostridiales bacterium]|nr:hypothetical protein [Clostridiales bacterium]
MKNRPLIMALFICVLILTSCTLDDSDPNHSDNESTFSNDKGQAILDDISNNNAASIKESIRTHDYLETIAYEDKSKYDAITFSTVSDDHINQALVDKYLTAKNMYKEKADDVLYYDGHKIAEVYFDNSDDRISFILSMWHFDENEPQQYAISCITVDPNDFDRDGYIIYDDHSEEMASNEYLYRNDDTLEAHIRYRHLIDWPFTLISTFDHDGAEDLIGHAFLNRNQKMWLFSDSADIDAKGKVESYQGDLFYGNACQDTLLFHYNSDDQLMAIDGSMKGDENEGDLKPFEMSFEYSNEGKLKKSNYHRPSVLYGTSDSEGEMLYDDEERMVLNHFYTTHGSISNFFFYHDSDIRPWAIVSFDSMPYGSWDEDGIQYLYGNPLQIQLFTKETN